jgi:hypothetical protein
MRIIHRGIIHRAVPKVSELCGKVYEAAGWVVSTLPRKLGYGKNAVANSEQRLHSVLATLEECRAALIDSSDRQTALLVSVAILELRMKLHRITDSELRALCDAMAPDEAPEAPRLQRQRRRPLLKLVK